MNREKETYQNFLNALFRLVAVFIFFIAFFSLIKWLMERTPAAPPAAKQTAGANPSANTRPIASTVFSASFTELFSGTGWKDKSKSTAYQDSKTTVISLPPAYDLEEISAFSSGLENETIIAAKGNGKEVVLAAADGKIFEFQNGAVSINQLSVINNQLSGALLDYDSSSGNWVIAVSSAEGIEAGPINRVSAIGAAGTLGGLACGGGGCLLIAGSSIYHFPISNPAALNKISLPFTASAIELAGKAYTSLSLGKTENILLVGGVAKSSSAYSGDIFEYSGGSLHPVISHQSSAASGVEPLFSSQYPGTIRFGYDSADDKILAVYAAYIGQAKLFSIDNQSQSSIIINQSSDYSRFFPQRVMEGMSAGDVQFIPEIFYNSGAWWLGPTAQSPVQKIARIEGGVLNDFADKISSSLSALGIQTISSLFIVPGFGDRQNYVFAAGQGGTRVFRLTDLGFETGGSVAWESSNLNQWNKELVSGSIFRVDAGDGNSITNGQSSMIKYYLSADGGQTWLPAKLGETVQFGGNIIAGNAGNDFRYKIEISPGSNQFRSPWVDAIGVEYSVAPND